MNPSWKRALRRSILAGAITIAMGWYLGQPWAGLAFACVGLLGWNLYNLYRLDRWLSSPKRSNPPDVRGLWGSIFYRIHRLQIKNRKRKRQFAQLLREFRKSTSAMPDGTVILSDQNQIDWFNRAAASLLGLVAARDSGQRVDNLIRNPKFVDYLERGDFSRPLEIRSPVRDDRRVSIHLVTYGRRDQRLLLVKDVTQIANLERTRRDFVANASHELRTPLTVVAGYLDAMGNDEALASAWHGPIEQMQQQTKNMTNIVEDLLELSRLESLQTLAPKKAVEVGSLLERISSEVTASLQKNVDIQIKLETSARLLGLESELHASFSNLIHNAVKFSDPGGCVKVSWSLDDAGGYLTVSDEGIGIPAEDIPRLTERFYRVDVGRSRQTGGTGLGLAIAKHGLGRHEADLEIHSTLGHGSTFSCHFPHGRIQKPTERAHLRAV